MSLKTWMTLATMWRSLGVFLSASSSMPSNALRFGVDGNGDGVVNLFTPADAIVSVASYLRGNGWKPGMNETETKAAVYAYNHSDLYVLAVTTVADRIRARLGGR